MRSRILAALGALVVAVLAAFGVNALAAGSASAAPENPALTGNRVLCGYFNGDQKMLTAPCSSHKDPTAPDGRKAWYVGPIPVPGAAGYAESIRAIVADMAPTTGSGAARFVDAKVTVAPGKTVEVDIVQPARSYAIEFDNDAPASATVSIAPAPVKTYQASAKTYTVTIKNNDAVDRVVSAWILVAAR